MKRKEFIGVLTSVLFNDNSISPDQMNNIITNVKKHTNKLQEGDCVAGLNEKQFNELIKIEGRECLDFVTSELLSDRFISNSIVFNGVSFHHTAINKVKRELSFDTFKQRAINTFKK